MARQTPRSLAYNDKPKLPVLRPQPIVPPLVLYIATGTDTSSGMVYQVDETGRVLGAVPTRYTPTGMALHRTNALVLAVPRDGGSILRIDDTGKLSTLLERDKLVPHPVDVGMAANSDSIVVADDIANLLGLTSSGGTKAQLYQPLKTPRATGQHMSAAVTNDKHVIFSSDAEPGIYRLGGDQSADNKAHRILPTSGCVAADPKSLRWAAAQEPNLIYVYEGEEPVATLKLPPGKGPYRRGLLSFSEAGSLCVACRDSDSQAENVWLLEYDLQKGRMRSLFRWDTGTMTDFVVGPRMRWDHNRPRKVISDI
jgi:hypothetical protein